MKLHSGKLNILMDGQFGSGGKGLAANYLGKTEHVDIAVSDCSPNAGHTFYIDGNKHIVKLLPVAGVLQPRSLIYFCPGAIIDPDLLLKELEEFNIDFDRVHVHPRCAVVLEEDRVIERDPESSVTKIASTQSGTGSALARKIMRSALPAAGHRRLAQFTKNTIHLQQLLDDGCTALMEMPQGLDLSINSGYSYPHCTSREITVSGALADAQVHPSYLGSVTVVIRTFPIRVGNIVKDGEEIGNSGPFYPDSVETTWDELLIGVERTTVTGRIRRVASFSMHQYRNMLKVLKPDYILLNFANYLSQEDLEFLVEQLPEVTHLGFGPEIKDVKLNHIL